MHEIVIAEEAGGTCVRGGAGMHDVFVRYYNRSAHSKVVIMTSFACNDCSYC